MSRSESAVGGVMVWERRAGHAGSASGALSLRGLVTAWSLSLFLHIAALAVMLMVVFPYTPAEPREMPVTLTDVLGEAVPAAAVPVSTSESASTDSRVRAPEPVQPRVSESLADLSALTAKVDLPIIGLGAGDGDLSSYGLSAGPAGGPEFFGLGGSARGVKSIVYVVDRSGSMLDTFGHVRGELRRSISGLRRSQKFHVIFFSSGEPVESPPRKLVSAIEARKSEFFDFLQNVLPQGSTHPEAAMRRALALEPDLIYFLTDGEFDWGLLGKLNEWNQSRRVRIYTIAFFDAAGATLLEHIAREHKGEFRFVSEHDLP